MVRGFTLVEMLIVLMIVGILAGLISANLRPSERDQLRVEAERLAQVLDLAVEESRISGKSLAWTADQSAYRFWRMGADGGWSQILDSDPLRARSLPQGMSLSDLRVEATAPQRSMRVEISPDGLLLAFTVELSIGAEHVAVAASPIGELRVTPPMGRTDAAMAPQ